ncbi:adenylyltransferase/cytidyltransferase family protein [Cytobacillus pseudoceanisediminis]|uniref:adenylyltransferase/cytidyltransferase family protein n=1 Tax=Cytobacillus pseudoceanisediminis TaxID=3051614 RepID=UPI00366062F2
MDKKIYSFEALMEKVNHEKESGAKIVLCHGCFDLFHIGHLRHLKKAKCFGDKLVVTITPDNFVNKGNDRPAFNHNLRAEMLEAINIVDYVGINNWDSAVNTLEKLRPDVYVKGSDYLGEDDSVNPNIHLEKEKCEELGIKLVFTKELSSSSTKLLSLYF